LALYAKEDTGGLKAMMPKPGDISTITISSGLKKKYVWIVCPDCGEGRWIRESEPRRPFFTGRCGKCSIRKNKMEGWPYDRRTSIS